MFYAASFLLPFVHSITIQKKIVDPYAPRFELCTPDRSQREEEVFLGLADQIYLTALHGDFFELLRDDPLSNTEIDEILSRDDNAQAVCVQIEGRDMWVYPYIVYV